MATSYLKAPLYLFPAVMFNQIFCAVLNTVFNSKMVDVKPYRRGPRLLQMHLYEIPMHVGNSSA